MQASTIEELATRPSNLGDQGSACAHEVTTPVLARYCMECSQLLPACGPNVLQFGLRQPAELVCYCGFCTPVWLRNPQLDITYTHRSNGRSLKPLPEATWDNARCPAIPVQGFDERDKYYLFGDGTCADSGPTTSILSSHCQFYTANARRLGGYSASSEK